MSRYTHIHYTYAQVFVARAKQDQRNRAEFRACGCNLLWGDSGEEQPGGKGLLIMSVAINLWLRKEILPAASSASFPNTHLSVPFFLSALLQSESSQLIGSLLHQVDVADRIGQGFNHIWRTEETNVMGGGWVLQGFWVFGLGTRHPNLTGECVGHVVLHFHVHKQSR